MSDGKKPVTPEQIAERLASDLSIALAVASAALESFGARRAE